MWRSLAGPCLAGALLAGPAAVAEPPAPPSGLTASDFPWDDGTVIELTWVPSPDDPARVASYEVLKAIARIGTVDAQPEFELVEFVPAGTAHHTVRGVLREISLKQARKDYAKVVDVEALAATGETSFAPGYVFQVVAIGKDGSKSTPAQTVEPIVPVMQWFMRDKLGFLFIVIFVCGAVVLFIELARRGRPLKIRKLAGLEAVNEAVGRATEMGRPILFVPGIQDMNDMGTIAGLNILARVSKTAAQYDAKIEVPTSRSLVMTTAREMVRAAYLEAGRPDAYNEDLIYYVTDEQFGYVAYLQGMMVRKKPAVCFYMGAFFAESLILAETGNSIGAIQIAGTKEPAQLPFFVAACDYTLIGEEFFAASAYLTGSPEELGSLKGQDVGKLIVAAGIIVGVLCATLATKWDFFQVVVDYMKTALTT
jgi:uncharacterized protein DUF6754